MLRDPKVLPEVRNRPLLSREYFSHSKFQILRKSNKGIFLSFLSASSDVLMRLSWSLRNGIGGWCDIVLDLNSIQISKFMVPAYGFVIHLISHRYLWNSHVKLQLHQSEPNPHPQPPYQASAWFYRNHIALNLFGLSFYEWKHVFLTTINVWESTSDHCLPNAWPKRNRLDILVNSTLDNAFWLVHAMFRSIL